MYLVIFEDSDTRIIEAADGGHRTFAGARAAAIEYLEELVAGCRRTLQELRKAGSYREYLGDWR